MQNKIIAAGRQTPEINSKTKQYNLHSINSI